MTAPTPEPGLELTVSVEFASGRERWCRPETPESRQFAVLLQLYLDDFVAALELPIRPRLEVRDASGSSATPRGGLTLHVGNRACRLPINRSGQDVETPEALARFIAEAVENNREALVNEELVEAVWPVLPPTGGTATAPVDATHRVRWRREFTRRGLALSQLELVHQRRSASSQGPAAAITFEEAVCSPDLVSVKLALSIEQIEAISADAPASAQTQDWAEVLGRRFAKMRLVIFEDLGIILPKIQVRLDPGLGRNDFRLQLNDLLLPPEAGLRKAEVLADESLDDVARLGVQGRPRRGMSMSPHTIVDSKNTPTIRNAGLDVWNPGDWIVHRTERAIRDRAEMFLTTYPIDSFRASSPHLVEAVRQRIGMPVLLKVLEGILEEGLSIRDLRDICESLLAVHSTITVDLTKFIIFLPPGSDLYPVPEKKPVEELDAADYLNCVRMAMKRQVSERYSQKGRMTVYLVDPQVEDWLKRIDVNAVSEQERRRLLTAVENEIGNLPPSTRHVILTSMESRRKLWVLIAREFTRFPVLTYQELLPHLDLQPIARISW